MRHVPVAEAETLEAAIEENTEKHSCRLCLNSAPLEITQRTEQYVIDQTKVRETELQLCDVPAKTEPSPSYSISASHLKPEAKPFLSRQTSVAFQPPDTTSQQPCTYENEYVRKSCEAGFENNMEEFPCRTCPVFLFPGPILRLHHLQLSEGNCVFFRMRQPKPLLQ